MCESRERAHCVRGKQVCVCVCALCALLFEARFHFGAQTAVIRDTPCLSLSSSGTAGQRPPLLLYFLFEFILLTTNRKFHKPVPPPVT